MTEPWYKEGLKFKCTGCGKCCTGAPGYVWVTPEEIEQMATLLGITVELFYRRYVRRVGQKLSLIEKKNGDCVFLQEGKFCQLYQSRPRQCRTFPFWPQTLRSKEAWEAMAEDCEGVDHPDALHYTAEEITTLMEKHDGEHEGDHR